MTIYEQLQNSGQAFLYIFIAPNANLNDTIMGKRNEQLERLKEMYMNDGTYTPTEMIEIIRQGIKAQYNKSPELILQIIFDNAKRIQNSGIGSTYQGLTFDPESNQHYDGSGNAYLLDNNGAIVQKNGQNVSADNSTSIENPSNVENIKINKNSSSLWTDIKNVIDFIVDILVRLGISKPKTTISNNIPSSSDWGNLNNNSNTPADFSTYLPWVVGVAIVATLMTGKQKKPAKKQKK